MIRAIEERKAMTKHMQASSDDTYCTRAVDVRVINKRGDVMNTRCHYCGEADSVEALKAWRFKTYKYFCSPWCKINSAFTRKHFGRLI